MPRLTPAAAVFAAALLAAPATAAADTTQRSIFEDETVLLSSGAAKRNNALDEMSELGVDTIRSLVYWNRIAPAGRTKPRTNLSQPDGYAATKWDDLDDFVRGAQARGIDVLLSPSAPAPLWASTCRKKSRTCKPNPSAYGAFVTALARRYSGTYADENQGGGVLPRVSLWSLWNEPNQPGWLYPQYERRKGRTFVSAAVHYRRLAAAGIRGLTAAGHTRGSGDQILLAETAPIGRVTGSLASRAATPVAFLRDLFCLSSRNRRLTGRAARARNCSRFKRLAVTGFAHHPYTRGGSQPPRARTAPGEITISTAKRLKTLLDAASRARRIPSRLPIWYTEFGYQTNPPDTFFGVPLAKQSEYLALSDYIAYRDSRVRSVAQYKLVDEPRISSFQTGLRNSAGRAKPSYEAYKLPLYVVRSGRSKVRVYGQVRPAGATVPEIVELQNQPPSGGSFETVKRITVTSARGHFLVSAPRKSGVWRLRWAPTTGGAPVFSREARTASR